MVLELVCGADFWCNRHCRTSPVVLEGFWGQLWPKIGRKPAHKSEFRIANEPLSQSPRTITVDTLDRELNCACPRSRRSSVDVFHFPMVFERFSGYYDRDLLCLAVHWQFGILIFQVFGRFSAKLGPKTPLERRGSSCSAGCSTNQPPRPILRPFRGNSEF